MTHTNKEKNVMPIPLHTPSMTQFQSPFIPSSLNDEEKMSIIAEKFAEIMEVLGLDLNDESLCRTPERVAKMYVKEIFSGLDPDNFPTISFFSDNYKHEEAANPIFMKVSFSSFCEHHFVPFIGTAYVSYLPHEKIIGLSKIPRIVRYFAKRPQIQERLTAQIADCLSTLLETENVAISITAQHLCIVARGIEDDSSYASTRVLRGEFNNNPFLQQEFISFCMKNQNTNCQ